MYEYFEKLLLKKLFYRVTTSVKEKLLSQYFQLLRLILE